jgi:hypothetical protein
MDTPQSWTPNEGSWKCAGIEAKFCEPYGGKNPSGLNPVYLRETALWQDSPNVRPFAQTLSPKDLTHSHLHAAQLLKHLLGLRKQKCANFVLVYLWFDVPGTEAARRHRQEIESFGQVLKRDRVAFVSRTYQEVFEVLRRRVSLARYTSPMPPAPSGAWISYGPSFMPEVSVINAPL